MPTIEINNQPFEVAEAAPLAAALGHWPDLPEQYAVAVNGQFVPRHRYPEFQINDGDRIDVVVPVSGG